MSERSWRPSSVDMYLFFSILINPLFIRFCIIPADVADVPILYLPISFIMFPELYLAGGFVLSSLIASSSSLISIPSLKSGMLWSLCFSSFTFSFSRLCTSLYPNAMSVFPEDLNCRLPMAEIISVASYS